MARPRHLPNSPISEVLIDIRTQLSGGFQVEQFAALKELFGSRLPVSQDQWLFEGVLKQGGEPVQNPAERKSLRGLMLKSKDELNVVQFRIDGFTYSRLKPYTKWESVFAEAWDLWKEYRKAFSPEVVTRIAVRYINRIEIPPPVDFSRYLEAPPTVPEGVPNRVNTFLSRIVVYDPDKDVATNLVKALDKGADPEHVVLLLDIDSYVHWDGEADDKNLKSRFTTLKEMDGRIFFASITEETARLFE
jgi:uncharacterized protein (TIGR04255 family)